MGSADLLYTDLLYKGLMVAAGMLSLWTAFLLTAVFVALAPTLGKSASTAATISSTSSRDLTHRALAKNGAKESTPARSLSKASPRWSGLGRALRLIQ
jgi:hypothetical protein